MFPWDHFMFTLGDDTLELIGQGSVKPASLEMVMATARPSWSGQWHIKTTSSRHL